MASTTTAASAAVASAQATASAGLRRHHRPRRAALLSGRARIVAVTPAGAKLAQRSREIVDRVHEEALGALPAKERDVFLRAMERLVEGHLALPVENTARRARQ